MSLPNLLSCLREEQRAMHVFIEALDMEAQCLSTRAKPDDLLQAIRAKEVAAQSVSDATEQRNQALVQLGYAPGRIGAQAAALAHPESEPEISQLFEVAQLAQSRNQRNSAMIEVHMDSTRSALNVLRSAAGANLYGANGKQARHPSGLGTARTA